MVSETQFGTAVGAEGVVQDGAGTCVAVMISSDAVLAMEDLDVLLHMNDGQQIAVSKDLVLFDLGSTCWNLSLSSSNMERPSVLGVPCWEDPRCIRCPHRLKGYVLLMYVLFVNEVGVKTKTHYSFGN